MTLTPRRNLPPDAEEWGRHVDKALADLRRKAGIVDTNVKSVIISSRASAGSFSTISEDVANLNKAIEETNAVVNTIPNSQRTQFPPDNPKHGDHWLDENNTLHIYVDYGTLPRRNYVNNPTLHLNADLWSVSGGTFSNVDGALRIAATGTVVTVEETVTRSVADAFWSASANVSFAGIPTLEDPEYFPDGLGPYTITVDIVGTDGTVYSTGSIADFMDNSVRIAANVEDDATPTSADVKVRVTIAGLVVDEILYLDQFILEAIGSVSEYFDATMPGVAWDGEEGSSPSYWDGQPKWVESKDQAAIKDAVDAARVELDAAREILNQADADLDARLDNAFIEVGNAQADATAAAQSAAAAQAAADQAQAEADAAAQAAADAAGLAGSKADVVFSGTAPAVELQQPTTLWIDTANGNTPKRWNGTAWVAVTDQVALDAAAAAASAQSTADAAQAAANAAQSTANDAANAAAAAQTAADAAASAANTAQATADAAQNAADAAISDATAAQAAADAAAADAAAAAGIAESKADVLIQSTVPPASMQKSSTLWIDTANGNTPKRWNGSSWQAVTDQAALDAAAAAAAAQSTANNAQTAASNAQSAADAAQAAADAADAAAAAAQATADDAHALAGTAESNAQAAIVSASAAQTTADTAVSDAAAAQAAADAAQADALEAAGIAANKGAIYNDPTPPLPDPNGLWLDPTEGNRPKRLTGKDALVITSGGGGWDMHTRLPDAGWTVTRLDNGVIPLFAEASQYDLVVMDAGYFALSSSHKSLAADLFAAGVSVFTTGNDTTSMPPLFSGSLGRGADFQNELITPVGSHPVAQGWSGYRDSDLRLHLTGLHTNSVIVGETIVSTGLAEPINVVLEDADTTARWVHIQTYISVTPDAVTTSALDWLSNRWVPVRDQAVLDALDNAAAAQAAADAAQATADNAVADAAAAQTAADAAAADAAAAAGIADSKADVLIQSTAPPADMQKSSTLWIDTTNGANTPKRWNGSSWAAVTDKTAIDAANAAAAAQSTANNAQTAANNAQSTANSKPVILFGTGAPSGTAPQGSIWWRWDNTTNRSIIGQWQQTAPGIGSTWQQETIASQVIANLDVGKLVAGTAVVDEAVVNKLWAEVVTTKFLVSTEKIITKDVIADGAVTARTLNVVNTDATTGNMLSLQPDGLRLWGSDDLGDPTISITTSDAQSISILDSADRKIAGMDALGGVVGAHIAANDSFLYKGEELADILERYPRGIIAASGSFPGTISEVSTSYGLTEIAFDMPEYTIPRYITFEFSGIVLRPWSTGEISLMVKITTDGSQPLVNSTEIGRVHVGRPGVSGTSVTVNGSIPGAGYIRDLAPGTRIRALLVMARSSSDSNNFAYINSGAQRFWAEDKGQDYGLGGIVSSGGGQLPGSSATPPPAASPVQTYTKSWAASGFQAYRNGGSSYVSSGDIGYTRPIQGYSSYTSSYGVMMTMLYFNHADIRSNLSGATIHKVELYLLNEHWYGGSGGTAVITQHGEAGPSLPAPTTSPVKNEHFARGEGKWVSLSGAVGTGFKNGTTRGLALDPGSNTSSEYYGYFRWDYGRPTLRITYSK